MLRLPPLRVIIFGSIGAFNTLFDLILYLIIYNLTHSVIVANTLATAAALIVSYQLNSRLTFKTKQWTRQTFIRFILITLIGLWLLQTGAIYVIMPLTDKLPVGIFNWLGGLNHDAKTLLPKLLATGLTLLWNYLWYSRYVFKDKPEQEPSIAT